MRRLLFIIPALVLIGLLIAGLGILISPAEDPANNTQGEHPKNSASGFLGSLTEPMIPSVALAGGQPQGNPTGASLEWQCMSLDAGGILHARVCNTGSGNMAQTTSWELRWAAAYQPNTNNLGEVVASGSILLNAGECLDITYDTSLKTGGYYGFRAFQEDTHPGAGELWITEIGSEPCPPIPDMTTIGLFSIGLLALGGFVWYRSHRRNGVVA